jgi:hypothetical protein
MLYHAPQHKTEYQVRIQSTLPSLRQVLAWGSVTRMVSQTWIFRINIKIRLNSSLCLSVTLGNTATYAFPYWDFSRIFSFKVRGVLQMHGCMQRAGRPKPTSNKIRKFRLFYTRSVSPTPRLTIAKTPQLTTKLR